MNTIENINTIVNEDTIEAAMDAVEAIPVKTFNWTKLGKVGAVVGIVVGTVAAVGYVVHKKQVKSKRDAAANDVDNVKVAEADFVENDSAEVE